MFHFNYNFVEIFELSEVDKQLLWSNQMLEDTHMTVFQTMLKQQLGFHVQNCSIHSLETIQLLPTNQEVLQIIHPPGHWICCHYKEGVIYIYDSFKSETLIGYLMSILKKLFPKLDLKSTVQFPTVQRQSNNVDCGVFAIANAVTCLIGEKPDKVNYDCSKMREHLIKIFETRIIEPFPKIDNLTSHKVIPLSCCDYKETVASYSQVLTKNKFIPPQTMSKMINSAKNKKILEVNKQREPELNRKVQKEHKRQILTWQGFPKLQLIKLSEVDESIIFNGDWLKDSHMSVFISILQNYTSYLPYETFYVQKCAEKIRPVPTSSNHIQILHSHAHWTCSFYDSNSKKLFVYDSLNRKSLDDQQKYFLSKLFLTYNLRRVTFPTVQSQVGINDCGVFAIAFAVSLALNVKPESIKYEYSLLRPYLLKLLRNHCIEHFPIHNEKSASVHVNGVIKSKEDERRVIKRKIEADKYDSHENICSGSKKSNRQERFTDAHKDKNDKDSSQMENSLTSADKKINRNKRYYEKNKDISKEKLSQMEKNLIVDEKKKIRDKSYREKNKDKIKRYREERKNKIKKLSQREKNIKPAETNEKNQNYYESNEENHNLCFSQKKIRAQRIVKKYRILSNNKIKEQVETFLSKISAVDSTPRVTRMEAEDIIKWCLASRKNDLCLLERILKNCRDKALASIERVEMLSSSDNRSKLDAMCGLSRHQSTGEAYFCVTAYQQGEKLYKDLVMNKQGRVSNVLPLNRGIKEQKGISWACDDLLCNIDDSAVIVKYYNFLQSLSEWTLSDVFTRVKEVQQCGALLFRRKRKPRTQQSLHVRDT